MIVHDERNEQWEVAVGDPAYSLVKALIAMGFRDIRLTEDIIRARSLISDPITKDELAAMACTILQLEQVGADKGLIAYLSEQFLNCCQLFDTCVATKNLVN